MNPSAISATPAYAEEQIYRKHKIMFYSIID